MREYCRAAVLALVSAALTQTAQAQSLQHVIVESFTLSADTLRARAGAPFHLLVTLRLRGRVTDIENLQLPLLASLQVLGDTRTIGSSARGTLYREVVTVSGPGGTVAISPATFDAIDARDGKAKEYSTNPLELHIQPTATPPRSLALLARALIVGGVATALLGLFLIWRASRPRVVRREPEPKPEPERPPTAQELLREALETLAADPTRRGALRARNAVRRMVGARDGETLADVIDRAAQLDRRLVIALPALERAAFTDDEDLAGAISGAHEALKEASR